MSIWEFLDRRWPTERSWVTIGLAILIGSLLKMADHDPTLWQVELFKTLLTAAVITGALNMVLAFHFTANKSDETKAALDEKRADNTAKFADAIKSVAENSGSPATDPAAGVAADAVAEAAADKAEEYQG